MDKQLGDPSPRRPDESMAAFIARRIGSEEIAALSHVYCGLTRSNIPRDALGWAYTSIVLGGLATLSDDEVRVVLTPLGGEVHDILAKDE